VNPATAPGGAPSLPDALAAFVELVNRGEYWESHEALEDAWRATGSEFYHGLILYASAFVHARRGTPHGIVAQLEKAASALADYPDDYLGLDVEAIRAHARACRDRVAARRGDRTAEADVSWWDLVSAPSLELRRGRIRGDEPELEGTR
jgi:predicted metal-dependent hydrolase